VQATDYLPLQRIAGYTEMQGNVKSKKVAEIMARINDRGAMRKRIEEETMTHIARYIAKRPDLTVDKLFDRFETDENGFIDIDELTAMFKDLEINVNN
jgi:Ca2+-binding EF-hand superfamily protein